MFSPRIDRLSKLLCILSQMTQRSQRNVAGLHYFAEDCYCGSSALISERIIMELIRKLRSARYGKSNLDIYSSCRYLNVEE